MPVATRIDVTGLRDLRGRFRKATAETVNALQQMGEDAGKDWQAEAERRAPRGKTHREGRRLADSITHVVTQSSSGPNVVRVTLRVGKPYAGPVIFGARAHDIVVGPKGKKYLHFFMQGHEVFTKKRYTIHHPGNKPNPFVQEARDAIGLDRRLRKAAQRVEDVLTRPGGGR